MGIADQAGQPIHSTSFENDQATAQNYYCLDAVARHGQIPAGEKARMKHATTK
jgi:hypothetical protein